MFPQKDTKVIHIILNAGFTINNRGKIVFSGGYFNNQDYYNEKPEFNSADTLDSTQFEGQTSTLPIQ